MQPEVYCTTCHESGVIGQEPPCAIYPFLSSLNKADCHFQLTGHFLIDGSERVDYRGLIAARQLVFQVGQS